MTYSESPFSQLSDELWHVFGGRQRFPTTRGQTPGEVREIIEDAVEGLESRLSLFLSREIHELTDSLLLKFEALNTRIKDLEEHVNEKDIALEKMSAELQVTREEVRRLSERNENAEMNSRIPCLVLSGSALAPQRGSHLAAPLPLPTDRSAPRGAGSAGPDGARAGGSGAGGGGGGGRSAGGGAEGVEDINGLVISVIRGRFDGLHITDGDIDRAHRLPGPNNLVIVRFVRSGLGSVRDQLMSRRMELRHRGDLFVLQGAEMVNIKLRYATSLMHKFCW